MGINRITSGPTRRRHLLRTSVADIDFDVAPSDDGSESVTLDDIDDALSELVSIGGVEDTPDVGDIRATGVCGNDLCETDEQCESDGSNVDTCCDKDCPYSFH